MNTFLFELKNFSKANWWIYLLLSISLYIVYITGKGNLVEIILLFLANFFGNLCIMVMQTNYTAKKDKIGVLYHVIAVSIFLFIALYGFFTLGENQYILWEVTYIGATVKAFMYYNYGRDLKFLNEKSFIIINLLLLFIFIKLGNYQSYALLQACGFSLITTGLVSIKDYIRYWFNVVGIALLATGSAWGVLVSYNSGSVDGIALGFFILTLTVFVYYIKLIKKYI